MPERGLGKTLLLGALAGIGGTTLGEIDAQKARKRLTEAEQEKLDREMGRQAYESAIMKLAALPALPGEGPIDLRGLRPEERRAMEEGNGLSTMSGVPYHVRSGNIDLGPQPMESRIGTNEDYQVNPQSYLPTLIQTARLKIQADQEKARDEALMAPIQRREAMARAAAMEQDTGEKQKEINARRAVINAVNGGNAFEVRKSKINYKAVTGIDLEAGDQKVVKEAYESLQSGVADLAKSIAIMRDPKYNDEQRAQNAATLAVPLGNQTTNYLLTMRERAPEPYFKLVMQYQDPAGVEPSDTPDVINQKISAFLTKQTMDALQGGEPPKKVPWIQRVMAAFNWAPTGGSSAPATPEEASKRRETFFPK